MFDDTSMSFAALIGVVGSATKAWRQLVKEMAAQDDRAYLTVSGACSAAECLHAFPNGRALRVTRLVRVSDLALVLETQSVHSLDLSSCFVQRMGAAGGLLHLLTGLRTLNLGRVSAQDTRCLSMLVNLKALSLRGTRALNVEVLTSLVQLTKLDLSRTDIANIRLLSALVDLRTLRLRKSQVTDARPLSSLITLSELDLSYTQIDDVGRCQR